MMIGSMELTKELKEKIIRSYIRGTDHKMNATFNGVSEEVIERIIEELWENAKSEGKQLEVGKDRYLSEKEIWLIGETAHCSSINQYRRKFKLSDHQLKIVSNLYANMSGRKVDTSTVVRKNVLVKMRDKKLGRCPECNHREMNLITEGGLSDLYYLLKDLDVLPAAIHKNAYCTSCLNEFFEIKHSKKDFPEGNPWDGVVKLNHWALPEY